MSCRRREICLSGPLTWCASPQRPPQVWTGLRFLAGRWFWSDRAAVSDGHLPQCPSVTQRCGALAKSGDGGLETLDCTEELNFLCYR